MSVTNENKKEGRYPEEPNRYVWIRKRSEFVAEELDQFAYAIEPVYERWKKAPRWFRATVVVGSYKAVDAVANIAGLGLPGLLELITAIASAVKGGG